MATVAQIVAKETKSTDKSEKRARKASKASKRKASKRRGWAELAEAQGWKAPKVSKSMGKGERITLDPAAAEKLAKMFQQSGSAAGKKIATGLRKTAKGRRKISRHAKEWTRSISSSSPKGIRSSKAQHIREEKAAAKAALNKWAKTIKKLKSEKKGLQTRVKNVAERIRNAQLSAKALRMESRYRIRELEHGAGKALEAAALLS